MLYEVITFLRAAQVREPERVEHLPLVEKEPEEEKPEEFEIPTFLRRRSE